MPQAKRDKTTGLPIPTPVVPPSTICLTLRVPNALEYRAALKGVLSELGKPWTWAQTVGQDNDDAFAAAELMREMVNEAAYQLDCGDTMNCDDIALCVQSSTAVRNAIGGIVAASPVTGRVFPPGVPLTPGQMATRLNEIEGCNPDQFWSQVEQFVDYMIDLGNDAFERIELYSNAIEAGENVPMGQLIGKLKNGTTTGKVLEFIDWVVDVMHEAYESADTAENRNSIKCALFCAGRDDCLLTIQGTLDVLNGRLGGLLSPDDLEDLPALAEAFTTAAINPTLALDLWLLFLMGTAKTAGLFGVEGIDETLQLILAVAVNDANNDWEILCEDCSDPTVELTPVIGSQVDTPGGILSGPDENGYYEAVATWSGFDYRVAIEELEGREFKLANLTFLDAVSTCQVIDFLSSPTVVECNFDTYGALGNPAIVGIVFTWAGAYRVRFQMVAP